LKASTPLLIGTLGEIYIERSGVLNLGAEGIMIVGAAVGFAVASETGNPYMGLLASVLAGMILAMTYGILVISLHANQTISGLALTMFGLGLSSMIGKKYVGIPAPHLPSTPIPLLSQIPIIGPLLFNYCFLVYFSIMMAILLWFILYKTRMGIAIRSVGESPAAADALGINVYKVRYMCTIFGGGMIGLSGAYISLYSSLDRRYDCWQRMDNNSFNYFLNVESLKSCTWSTPIWWSRNTSISSATIWYFRGILRYASIYSYNYSTLYSI